MGNRQPLLYDEIDSPIGPLTIISSGKGICSVEFAEATEAIEARIPWFHKHFLTTDVQHHPEHIRPVVKQLEEYFNQKRNVFSVALDLVGTPFQKKVWQYLMEIPYGVTCSYKQVAESIGSPKAVRAIGNANNRNPVPIIIPCHRVVGSNGALVGYGGGLDKKEVLLGIENATI